MVHQREGLPLRLEARHQLAGVSLGFDQLESRTPSPRFTVLGRSHLVHESGAGGTTFSNASSGIFIQNRTATPVLIRKLFWWLFPPLSNVVNR